jgi:hypothetical protein
VVMKSSVFQDITPCSPLRVDQHFRGICHIHFQGHIISHARNRRVFQRTTRRYVPGDRTLHSNELLGSLEF